MMTGAFSRNVGKLFSELKLVTDNLPLHSLIMHPDIQDVLAKHFVELACMQVPRATNVPINVMSHYPLCGL